MEQQKLQEKVDKLALQSWILFICSTVMACISTYICFTKRQNSEINAFEDSRKVFNWIESLQHMQPLQEIRSFPGYFCPDDWENLLFAEISVPFIYDSPFIGVNNKISQTYSSNYTQFTYPENIDPFSSVQSNKNYSQVFIQKLTPYQEVQCGKRVQIHKKIDGECQGDQINCSKNYCVENGQKCPLSFIEFEIDADGMYFEFKQKNDYQESQDSFIYYFSGSTSDYPCFSKYQSPQKGMNIGDCQIIPVGGGFKESRSYVGVLFLTTLDALLAINGVNLQNVDEPLCFQAKADNERVYDSVFYNFYAEKYEEFNISNTSFFYENNIKNPSLNWFNTTHKNQQQQQKTNNNNYLHKRNHKSTYIDDVDVNVNVDFKTQQMQCYGRKLYAIYMQTRVNILDICKGIVIPAELKKIQAASLALPDEQETQEIVSLAISYVAGILFLLLRIQINNEKFSAARITIILMTFCILSLGIFWIVKRMQFTLPEIYEILQQGECFDNEQYNSFLKESMEGLKNTFTYHIKANKIQNLLGWVITLFVIFFYLLQWLCEDPEKQEGTENLKKGFEELFCGFRTSKNQENEEDIVDPEKYY